MKLPGNRLTAFLKAPDAGCRAALFYGPDIGLVRERADRLTQAVCADLKDPFRIAELSAGMLASDPARLADEVAAMSLTGGRRVVRIRGAEDAAAALLAPIVKSAPPKSAPGKSILGDTLIVVESSDLGPRSSLRKLFEAEAQAVAVACYADTARDLGEVIREQLGQHRIALAPDALAYLTANLGGDRAVTRSELEKLALYAGEGGRVSFEDAVACVGDTSLLSIDDVIFAAADGEPKKLETALARALAEGENPISIIRAVMRHFHRLHLAGSRIAAGSSPEDALRALRPPVFFKYEERFKSQLTRWPPRRVAQALAALTEAELNMKRSILPQETIGRAVLFDIARAGAARGNRRP